jgi:hypothetical protein
VCIWVSAGNTPVSYEYCSERIVPNSSGGLDLVADMLLQNRSDGRAVDELLLIYPHAFPLRATPTPESGEWRFDGEFEDISLSLRSQDDARNRLYLASGEIKYRARQGGEKHPPLTLVLPDPNFPDRTQVYQGGLPGNNEIAPGWAGMTESQWRVLSVLDFSVWRCLLCVPLDPDERRWFRWSVAVPPSEFNRRNRWSRIG